MNWKPLSAEEAKGLKYASRTGKESPYKALLDAVEQGPVRVDVPPDSTLQSLKWALSRQIKKSGKQVVVATLADKSGVVLSKEATEPAKK
jgi:hypothetical protein